MVYFMFRVRMPRLRTGTRGPWTTQELHNLNLRSSENDRQRKGRYCCDRFGEYAAELSTSRPWQANWMPVGPVIKNN